MLLNSYKFGYSFATQCCISLREIEGRNLKVFTDPPFSRLSVKLTATGDITLHEAISRMETVVAGMPGSFQHLGSLTYKRITAKEM
jgi:hypothetical protein